jgi:hypothetical protein
MRPRNPKQLILIPVFLAGLLMGGCATGEHHSSDDQSPPSMGDFNNACNPHSHNQLGAHLPRKDLCYEQPTGSGG